MAEWTPIPLGLHSYQARSLTASAQRLGNFYPEINPEGAKGPVVLYPTPGLKSWLTGVGDGPCRGLHRMGDDLFVVSGNELYHVTKNKVVTLVGAISGAAPCRLADNGVQVAVVSDIDAYAATSSSIVTLPFGGFNGVTAQDGYGIFSDANTLFFRITARDNMASMAALDFSSADVQPDRMMGVISDHREVVLFKERSIEVWYNSGGALFPFARIPAGFVERGCIASCSIAKNEHHVFWLGDDLSVYTLQGYQPIRISTPAIDQLIQEQNDPRSAVGFAYTQHGHPFYVLSFQNLTVVYDAATQRWHERYSPYVNRWRASHYAHLGTTHIVGDFETGDLYELDLDTFTDNGDQVERLMESATLQGNGRRLSMPEFFADLEMGVGNVTGTDSDPRIDLSWSDDGGKTWSTPKLTSLGQLGQYRRRAQWSRCGAFFQRVLRLRIRSSVKVALVTPAYARMEAWQ